MKKVFKGEKGSALITVLIVMGVLTVLGAALLHYSLTDNLQVINDEKRMQAHYLARSGAEAVADYIMKNPKPEKINALLDKESDSENLGKGTFKVKVTEKEPGVLLIESTGDVNGFERTVKLTMLPFRLGDFAVFCNSIIEMGGNAAITGNVGTNATDANSIKLSGNSKIDGNVHVGPGGNPDTIITDKTKISGEIGQLDSERNYEVPEFPAFPDLDHKDSIELGNGVSYEISEDGSYKKIYLKNHSKLVIDVDSDVLNIVVEELVVEGDIEIKGDGCLNLYVNSLGNKNKIDGNVNKDGRVKAVMMYYKGNSIDINGGVFCGTIFSDSTSFKLAGNGKIDGNIIASGSDIENSMTGGAAISGAFYAPNSTIKFSGNSVVNGLVVANDVVITGTFGLEYNDKVDFPYNDHIICPGFRKGIWSD